MTQFYKNCQAVLLAALFLTFNSLHAQDLSCGGGVALPDGAVETIFIDVSYTGALTCPDASTLAGVNLVFDHEYLGDLQIILIAPSGEGITLIGEPNFTNGANNTFNTTFTTNALDTPWDSASGLTSGSGTWQPFSAGGGAATSTITSFSQFSGSACGVWGLKIVDAQAEDSGNLTTFTLQFPPSDLACTSGASPVCPASYDFEPDDALLCASEDRTVSFTQISCTGLDGTPGEGGSLVGDIYLYENGTAPYHKPAPLNFEELIDVFASTKSNTTPTGIRILDNVVCGTAATADQITCKNPELLAEEFDISCGETFDLTMPNHNGQSCEPDSFTYFMIVYDYNENQYQPFCSGSIERYDVVVFPDQANFAINETASGCDVPQIELISQDNRTCLSKNMTFVSCSADLATWSYTVTAAEISMALTKSAANAECYTDITDTHTTSCPGCAVNALPVELTSFTGYAKESVNVLRWASDNEINFSHYTLERAGADLVYRPADRQEGKGQPSDYSFIDMNPETVSYYRLRMTDLDGTETLSEVVRIENKNRGFTVSDVAPMPVQNTVNFKVSTAAATDVHISLYDASGKLHIQQTSLVEGSVQQNLEVSDLPAGVYFLRVQTQSETVSQRIIKR